MLARGEACELDRVCERLPPVRGTTNEPAHVVHTVAALAAIRGEDASELTRQIDANAAAVFSLP